MKSKQLGLTEYNDAILSIYGANPVANLKGAKGKTTAPDLKKDPKKEDDKPKEEEKKDPKEKEDDKPKEEEKKDPKKEEDTDPKGPPVTCKAVPGYPNIERFAKTFVYMVKTRRAKGMQPNLWSLSRSGGNDKPLAEMAKVVLKNLGR